jgi:hypothetical protein
MLPAIMAKLGADMMVQLQENAPSDEDKVRVDRCFEQLQSILQAELGTRWHLKTFGSIASGFSTSTSDMDATCVQGPAEDGAEQDEKEELDAKTILLEKLSPLLRELPEFSVIEEIAFAKVPILRLRFEDRLDVDLSCRNTAALLNTRLLRAYADLDPRVRDLGVAVKLWAKAANVCGAAQSKLSSYAFTLLVIYFLQVHEEVNLPCLETSLFEDDSDPSAAEAAVAAARSSWSCPLSLPDLLFRFIGFYTVQFEWGREVASIRVVGRRNCRDSAFHTLRGHYVNRIHIEDPFILERNLHCVLGDPEEMQLKEAFQTAWQLMFVGGTPVGLHPLGDPFAGPKMELQLLSALESPQSSPDLGPASSPQVGASLDVVGASAGPIVSPANASESPGTFSSAGSTECGDGPSSSAGESRSSDDEWAAIKSASEPVVAHEGPKQWWQNLGATDGAVWADSAQREASSQFAQPGRPRVLSLAELEGQMVHTQDAAALRKHSSMSAPGVGDQASANSQWWLNLGSANIIQAVQAANSQEDASNSKQEKKNNMKMGVRVQDLEASLNIGVSPLLGGSFAMRSTRKIASRVAGKYFGQTSSAVKVN